MDAVFEGFAGLIGKVVDCSTEHNTGRLFKSGQRNDQNKCDGGEDGLWLFHVLLN